MAKSEYYSRHLCCICKRKRYRTELTVIFFYSFHAPCVGVETVHYMCNDNTLHPFGSDLNCLQYHKTIDYKVQTSYGNEQ